MLYLLLPFFVAVSTPVENDVWKYGPEYTFSGHVKMIADLEMNKATLMGNNLIFDLRCQPRMNDTFICRFEDTRIARIKPRYYDTSGNEDSEEFKKFGLMTKMFAVKFNDKGIDSYVIEKTSPPLPLWCLDMIRLAFNQLSISASIADEYTPKFRLTENFTIGECPVDYTISRLPSVETRKNNDGDFELVALENIGQFHDETIEILKKRDVNDCLVCADYFFGSRYNYGIVLRDVLTKLKSSISRIFISKNELIAETVNEVELFGKDRELQGNVLDHMTIRLVSVLPAVQEFVPLKNPVHMEVVANRPGSPYVQ